MQRPVASLSYSVLGLFLLTLFVLFCMHSTNISSDITLALVMITVGLLVSGLVMEYLAVLFFLSAIVLLNLSPVSVTFSGFTSPAFWLTFAGIPLGLAIKKTGLADRAAHFLVRFCGERYLFLVIGLTLFGFLMAFIMPSGMGRMMLIVPILIAFSEANGFLPGSKGYNGLLLAGIFGTYIPGFAILPSNLPNIILMGSTASLYHMNLNYATYLLWNFPILGIIKAVFMVGIVTWWFKDTPTSDRANQVVSQSKFSPTEKRLILYIAIILVAWVSDSLTQLSPAWPALFMGLVCLLPRIGVLNHKNFMKEINIEPLFYVGGLIGLSVILSYSGLGALLGQKLIEILPFSPSHPALDFYLLSLSSALVGVLMTSPGVPAILTPLSMSLAHVTGLPLLTVLMTQVIGFSMYILPYQGPPVLVAMRLSNIPFKDTTKLCLAMFLISIIFLLPLNYLWWKAIGVI